MGFPGSYRTFRNINTIKPRYPHAIGSIPLMKEALDAINVSEPDRAAIMGGTAAKLYGL